jgi:hypothetical protein
MSEPSQVVQIGRHSAAADGDLVTLRMRGRLSVEELRRSLRVVEQSLEEQGRVFVLVDHSEIGETGPEIRRELAEWARARRLSGIAVCGASLGLRAVSGLLVRGIALLYDRPDLIERVAFVRTEAEARAFLAERRARLDARAAPAAPEAPGPPG